MVTDVMFCGNVLLFIIYIKRHYEVTFHIHLNMYHAYIIYIILA